MKKTKIWILTEESETTDPLYYFTEEGEAEEFIRYEKEIYRKPGIYIVYDIETSEDLDDNPMLSVVFKHSFADGTTELDAVFVSNDDCDAYMKAVSNNGEYVFSSHDIEQYVFADEEEPFPVSLDEMRWREQH